jgi:serine/threonine-protein kinase RsbW
MVTGFVVHSQLALMHSRNGIHSMKHAEIVLYGSYSAYGALNAFIASFAESQGYSTMFTEDLQLTLKEAFVNAVKHGNREKEGLSVSCALKALSDTLLVAVRDCGKGFNPAAVPNPVDSANLFKLSGRGVYIIKHIAEIISLECDQYGSVLMLRYFPY